MAIFKCKMCGGDLQIANTDKVIECEYCGTSQTVPTADNEKKLNLFNRANRLRINGEFDKAESIYESIVAEFPEEAEAYWGLVICNYGIEYVDDPATSKKIPTCHRASFKSIQNDENFKLALEYADVIAQKVYRDEAREIDRIREEILALSKNEQPYDIFICYKETADNGERTIDSVIAQDLYDRLTDKGYKVFFSRISLEDKLGRQYEPYIFAALNSAKIMLSVGTKYEYFHAVWVKNEWSRFLKLMAKDKSKVLIPCYKDMDAYDLPDEFKALQAQDLGKVGAVQDLLRGIDKIIKPLITNNVKANTEKVLNQDFHPAKKDLTEKTIHTIVTLVTTISGLHQQAKTTTNDSTYNLTSNYVKDLVWEVLHMLEKYNPDDYKHQWISFCVYKGFLPYVDNYINEEQIADFYKKAIDLSPDYLKDIFKKEKDKELPSFEFLIFNQEKLKKEYEEQKNKPTVFQDEFNNTNIKKSNKKINAFSVIFRILIWSALIYFVFCVLFK